MDKTETRMKVVSLLNLKGGVAKSFSAANIGYELWKRGYRILLWDNDKQGNLSRAYNRYEPEQISPVTRILTGDWRAPEELIQSTDYEGMDILTANLSMFGAVWNLMKEGGQEMVEKYQKFLGTGETGETLRESYDYCLIDNPPDISLNVLNALMITDEVIVPVKIDEHALDGLEVITEQIRDAKALNPSLTLKGILVTSYQNTDGEAAGLEWLREQEKRTDGEENCPVLGVIRYSKRVAENSFLRKPIYESSPCCAAAQDYKKFVTDYTGKER